jgi:hypothetical protein
LAKLAISQLLVMSWMEECPSIIQDVVLQDITLTEQER